MSRGHPAKRWIYWLDLSATAAAGWTALAVAASGTGALRAAAGAAAALLGLRALTFVHEIAHRRRGELPGFEWFWNAVVGIPMCVPSFLYVGSHLDHHRAAVFGTDADPEYAPIAHWSPARVLAFLLGAALVPSALVLRFGLLAPASALSPGLRRRVVAGASTLAINPRYARPPPTGRARTRWLALEVACCAFVWSALAAWLAGWLPTSVVALWLAVCSGVFLANQLRTLVAHRFDGLGQARTEAEQLLDSVTLPDRPLLALLAPLGLRYHALHHLRPGLPYHALGRVHRAMLSGRDADAPTSAPYRETLVGGVLPALRVLLPSRRALPVSPTAPVPPPRR